MCLFSRSYCRTTADSDIECYKVVEKKPIIYKDGTISVSNYRSPFVGYNYGIKFDSGMELKPEFPEWEQIEKEEDGRLKITGGFIHGYKYLEDAVKIANGKIFSQYSEVYKCIIPNGTEYYVGCTDQGTMSYAAKKMEVVGRVSIKKD